MLVYVHVPFCRAKCAYCAFYSTVLPRGRAGRERARAYLSALLAELHFWGRRLEGREVESVFFGGGTPSLLPASALGGIIAELRGYFSFAPDAEITAEANPESALDSGWLFAARDAGVNRLSLGLQSFDDARLGLLGRLHDARSAEAAFATARSAGFNNISLDLMWGLPGCRAGEQGGAAGLSPQSQSGWLSELRRAVELRPEHISAYGLTLEEGSALAELCAADRCQMPGEGELGSMYLAGGDFLESRGYMQYEISNYARMGFACRHNLGYWQGKDYLGLGPAAASTLEEKRWTNAEDMDRWRAAVREKALGGDAESLDPLKRKKEMLMLRLRMNKGLDLRSWSAAWQEPFLARYRQLTAALQLNGLAAVRSGRFRLTRAGFLVSDTILSHFFAALDEAAGLRGGGPDPGRWK
ncbi:radical SAM family heme chaperone HemW [Desulfovibrio sp. OttesenSCG-928-A18]|nr:radical SAM family heme chaperone HemW [Desulfovibrio sp. OttesenSCG-928-A18]